MIVYNLFIIIRVFTRVCADEGNDYFQNGIYIPSGRYILIDIYIPIAKYEYMYNKDFSFFSMTLPLLSVDKMWAGQPIF